MIPKRNKISFALSNSVGKDDVSISMEGHCHRSITLVHSEHGREGFLCVVEGAIAVIKDPDAVPELRVLLQSVVRRWHGMGAQRRRRTLGLGR
jgi:hypothetical protein